MDDHVQRSTATESSAAMNDLFSRQLLVLGEGGQRSLFTASVLLIGLDDAGVEIAKNLALTGVGNLSLSDGSNGIVNHTLCSQQSTLSRAEACAQALMKLNEFCQVQITSSCIDAALAAGSWDVVVLCNRDLKTAISLNEKCRQLGIHFVLAQTRGVFGSCFVDLGQQFTVADPDDETPHVSVAVSISNVRLDPYLNPRLNT